MLTTRWRNLSVAALILIGAFASCGTPTAKDGLGTETDGGEPSSDAGSGADDAGPTDIGAFDAGASTTDAGGLDGLPCDLSNLLQTRCMLCHGHPTAGSAPISISSYDELRATSSVDSSTDVAHRSLIRMRSSTSSMPPGVTLTASEIAILDRWIAGGEQPGTCQTESPDAGTTDPGGPDAGTTDPADAGSDAVPNSPPTCTSGITWFLGDLGTDLMHPGRACIDCHTSKHKGPSLTVAGTVYPTTHEPDDCDGTSSGISVIITDAGGHTVTLQPNSVGNFRSSTALQMPYTAKVVNGARTRSMLTPQTTGDCNSCHTQNGANSAPGRIVAP